MLSRYNPLDWYWVVGTNTAQAWSSKRSTWIDPRTDNAYLEWAQLNNQPTTIDSIESLVEIMSTQWMPTVVAAGITIQSTANTSLNGTYATDPTALAYITGLAAGITAGKALPGGGTTFAYPVGSAHMFSGPDFLNFANAIELWIYQFAGALQSQITQQNPVAIPSSTLPIA